MNPWPGIMPALAPGGIAGYISGFGNEYWSPADITELQSQQPHFHYFPMLLQQDKSVDHYAVVTLLQTLMLLLSQPRELHLISAAVWRINSIIRRIKVTLHWARLVLGWVTVIGHVLPHQYVTNQVNSALHLSGLLNQVPASVGWGKGRNVTSVRWQVTLCDPIWHVSSRSGKACCELLYQVILLLHLLIIWARRWINHLSLQCIVNAMPDLWLPAQLQNITALWPVPNYTVWWQREVPTYYGHQAITSKVTFSKWTRQWVTVWMQLSILLYSITHLYWAAAAAAVGLVTSGVERGVGSMEIHHFHDPHVCDCEQLAQGRQPHGRKLNVRLLSCKSNALTRSPPGLTLITAAAAYNMLNLVLCSL